MAVVTVHAFAKTGGSKRDGGLANDREVTVVTVGVTPNTIDLRRTYQSSETHRGGVGVSSYQLVVADNSHHGEGLHANGLRIPSVPVSATLVTEDDIRVGIGVKIPLAGAIASDSISESGDILGITRVAAAAIISRATLDTITVDVHVGESAVGALKVDDTIIGKVITAVGGGYVKELC